MIFVVLLFQYPYSMYSAALSMEFAKMCLAFLYFQYIRPLPLELPAGSNSSVLSFDNLLPNRRLFKYFAIPAGLYLVYNLLAFVSLLYVEPITCEILLKTRILFSGLLLQFFFQQQLSFRQWFALVLLMLGCTIEQLGSFRFDLGILAVHRLLSLSSHSFFESCFCLGFVPVLVVLIQGFCSSLGGVYFQWLLQRPDAVNVSMWEKNTYLYFWGVLFNISFLLFIQPDVLFGGPQTFFKGWSLHHSAICRFVCFWRSVFSLDLLQLLLLPSLFLSPAGRFLHLCCFAEA